MVYVLRMIKESGGLLIALSAGIYAYKYLNFFWRMALSQAFIYFIFVIVSYGVTSFEYDKLHLPEDKLDSQFVYNIAMPFEFLFLFLTAWAYLSTKINKALLLSCVMPFIAVYLIQIQIKTFWVFANYAYIVEGFIVIFLFSLIVYFLFNDNKFLKNKSPELYLSIGLIVYFACASPYLASFEYLRRRLPASGITLFNFIIDFLSNIRYLLLGISFWLLRRNAISINTTANEA